MLTATRPTEVVSRPIGDEYLVMHTGLKQYHVLNATAAAIWELAGDGLDAPTIVDAVAQRFDAERADVAVDVVETLQGFSDLGLVVLSEPMP